MSLFTDQFDMVRFVINKCIIGVYLKGGGGGGGLDDGLVNVW